MEDVRINGFDLGELQDAVDMIREQPEARKVSLRSHHEWDEKYAVDGYAEEIEWAGQVYRHRHTFRSDFPRELDGTGSGPTPTQYLMAALGVCIASTYASHAAASGVEIEELTVDLEAELDLRGLFQLASVRPGPTGVKAKVKVKSDADEAVLEELARLAMQTSPTYDSVSNPVPIESSVERVA